MHGVNLTMLLWTMLLSGPLLLALLTLLCFGVHTWNTPFTLLDTTGKGRLRRRNIKKGRLAAIFSDDGDERRAGISLECPVPD
jgi:hypothetical protein